MPTGDFPCQYCGSYYCGQGDLPRFCDERIRMMRPKTTLPAGPLPDPFALPDDPGVRERFEKEIERVKAKASSRGTTVPGRPLLEYLTEYLGDEVFAKRFADCIDLIKAKNSDYTGGAAKRDRIAHFREAAEDLDLSMLKIWQVFVRKHWAAVQKFANGGALESEPIDGRINDIINYMVLLGAIVEDLWAQDSYG